MVVAFVAAACGAAALGCSESRKAIALIAREDPAALSLAAEQRPGGGPDGRSGADTATAPNEGKSPRAALTASSATPGEEQGDAARSGEETSAQPARGQARERRRRSSSAVDARADEAARRRARGEGATGVPELKVTRLVVSRGIAGREPLAPASSFSIAEADRIHAFVELANESQTPSEIHVTFTPPAGRALQRIPLDVGAQRRFRTWATTRKARTAGVWSVAVSDAAGNELARTSFTVTN
jgi:hypothetical protein